MSDNESGAIPKSLFAAMVVQFAVGGATLPFISMLLRDRGLDFHGISSVLLGSSATLLIFPFLWGMLADRFIPINRLFVLLNLLAFCWLIFFSGQNSFWGLLVGFTGFYACYNPTLTLINALSFHHLKNPREQFARLRAWGSLGWILPSLPIYFWLWHNDNSQLDFTLKLGMFFAFVMAFVAMLLPHTPPGARVIATGLPIGHGYWEAMKRLLRDANYLTILVSFFLMAGSWSILMFYSLPFLEDRGVPRAWIGPIQCIGVVVEIILCPWLPTILNRWQYTASIATGCFVLAGRQFLFAQSDNRWLLSGSYVSAGVVIVLFNIGASILVNSMAGLEVKATAQTLMLFFGSGMGPVFANWVAGHLARHNPGNIRPVFLFASGLAGLAAVLIASRGSKLNHAQLRQTP